MRIINIALARTWIIGACAAWFAVNASGADAPRLVQSLDENWRFHLGAETNAIAPGFDDSVWRVVDVPHDYVVEGTFQKTNPFPDATLGRDPGWYWLHGFLPVQAVVYRKSLEIPASAKGKNLWLEFDGVFSNSRYWVNGREVGSQYSGYTRSRFDITKAANCGGTNVLTVQVDPRYDGWWYEGGGIYRHVRLVTVDPVHVSPDGVFVMPTVADPGDGVRADATVALQTELTNSSPAEAPAVVLSEVLNARGKVVASAKSKQKLLANTGEKVAQQLALSKANLWSPDNPTLYQLRTTVSVAGKTVDQLTTKFGMRQVRFDAERGFFLNGKPLKLQGVNIHQDHAGVGVAVPDRLFTWRLERLKEVGCNAIRTSHNPVAPFLLDECDRLGIFVVAENRHLGDTYMDQTSKDVKAVEHRDLSALVRHDRNHASIIAWSLCNEQWTQGSPEAAAMIRSMKERVHELDPTRPVTAAMNGGFDKPEGFLSVLDVIGINYNPVVYDSVHALRPTNAMIATEIASEISTRGIYATNHWDGYQGDRERGYIAAYSTTAGPGGQTVENAWPRIATNDFMGGGFVWSGFDYKGEPRPFEWPVINSHYGFMDICGFPKDSYYYYQSWWTDKPVLHLFPHWNWSASADSGATGPGKEGQEIPVWVHSNCEEVELFLNGVSLGKKVTKPYQHLEWNVKYAPGKLIAKGIRKGKTIEAIQETTGAPAAIRLSADCSKILADNADISVVKVEVVDAKGRLVPIADNKIRFSIAGAGKIIGVGNGDPSCHEPDKASERSAFNGLAQVIVQSTHATGKIKLTATADGLVPATVIVQAQPCAGKPLSP